MIDVRVASLAIKCFNICGSYSLKKQESGIVDYFNGARDMASLFEDKELTRAISGYIDTVSVAELVAAVSREAVRAALHAVERSKSDGDAAPSKERWEVQLRSLELAKRFKPFRDNPDIDDLIVVVRGELEKYKVPARIVAPPIPELSLKWWRRSGALTPKKRGQSLIDCFYGMRDCAEIMAIPDIAAQVEDFIVRIIIPQGSRFAEELARREVARLG